MCVSIAQARAKSDARVLFDFGLQQALVKCPNAFRLHRLAQNVNLSFALRHIASNFSRKIVLLKCPCAFRLCRLMQNVGLSVVCGIYLNFFASNSSCDMSICISTVHAGTKRKLKCWSTAFYLRILTSHCSCDMSMSALRGFQAVGLRPAFSL